MMFKKHMMFKHTERFVLLTPDIQACIKFVFRVQSFAFDIDVMLMFSIMHVQGQRAVGLGRFP